MTYKVTMTQVPVQFKLSTLVCETGCIWHHAQCIQHWDSCTGI